MATPAPTVVAGLRQALKAHAPFSGMPDADLEDVVRAATVRYFAPGETILSPGDARPAHCLFVRQGSVRGERSMPSGGASAQWEHSPGDMFPLGALLARRGVTSHYTALADTFVLAFPATLFDALVQRSPVFQDFCTRRIQHLLDLSRQRFQAEYAATVTEQRGLATPLASILRHAPVTVPPSMPLGEALALMEERRIGSLPIVDADGRPTGIFTRQDVIGRVVLAQTPLGAPIALVASAPVVTLPRHATAGDAALAMAQRGIRHVVTIDDGGRVAGVVSERDLFGLQRLSVRELASTIRRAGDVPALQQCAADIRALSYALVAQGVASGQLTRMIASLNDQLTVRLLDLVAARHDLGGLACCWIGMGSEGRGEQTIATDQDNGLVFASNDENAAPDALRERLLPFAAEANRALDACGYPLCKGGVMAMNPRWCASLGEWRDAFFGWIDRGDPQSLLDASIFFDFRGLWGETGLAEVLRSDIAARAKANPRFLKQMSDNALRSRPPLNWLGELAPQGGDADGIDVKLNGTALFVDAARILALAAGITATNTAERLLAAGPLRGIPAAELRGWCDAFEYLQLVRLRTQHRRASGALPPAGNPNLVPLSDLSEVDRRIVKEAMRQAKKLQQRLELDYPG
ncbi:MAG: CBS domain-containing protein [Burkholderiales bacterium]|nr:CBS domain-containing protein [Burkholderiales bacterium]GIK85783.1 MAG: cyclic nucleotide-binding protein [Betaproteobacteria bacterium]